MSIDSRQITALDHELVERNSFARSLAFFICVPGIVFLSGLIGTKLSHDWFSYGTVGLFVGIIIGLWVLIPITPKFMVKVEAVHALVTVNSFVTAFPWTARILGWRVYNVYGPGSHFALPPEDRDEKYSITLQEVTQRFNVTVQCKNGDILIRGSFRFRPDIQAPVAYISGVADMAGGATDLIHAFILSKIADKDVHEVILGSIHLNNQLREHFVHGKEKSADVSWFEERFGLYIGDVTAAEIELSQDIRKTIAGASETISIMKSVALMLGFTDDGTTGDTKRMNEALKSGTLKKEDYDRALKYVLSITKNTPMEINTNEHILRLEGIDENLTSAVENVAPALLAIMQKGQGRGKKGRRNRSN